MTESPSQRALSSSAVALAVAVACLMLFVPPLFERVLDGAPVRIVLNALVMSTAMLLHWVFLGQALRRMGRALSGWLALAVLLFPVGSAAALILLWSAEAEALHSRPAALR